MPFDTGSVSKDRTEWDEVFRPTFSAPKKGGTRCSTGRNLGEFSFRLTPWNDSFYIRGTQNYNISVSFFFLFVSVMSRPVPSHLHTKRYLKDKDLRI
ncbi:hypothetical protein DVH24_040797 [Malus domestica]|uniref:Uncharacterized protein n=1 Tax=Malus domestica TaxID=3750 RepID=A0A498I922_MALDO|nr:hypothetical protein DVH24_040797 [Malus domestica]